MWKDELFDLGHNLNTKDENYAEKAIKEARLKLLLNKMNVSSIEDAVIRIAEKMREDEMSQVEMTSLSKETLLDTVRKIMRILRKRKEIDSPIKFLKQEILIEFAEHNRRKINENGNRSK